MFFSIIFSVGLIILYGIVWWKIFDKTGYGGAYGLLMFIPIINFIMLLVLAFTEWPAL